jgi:hypothetical protein
MSSSKEADFFGEITDNNIRHQPLGDGPCFSGYRAIDESEIGFFRSPAAD